MRLVLIDLVKLLEQMDMGIVMAANLSCLMVLVGLDTVANEGVWIGD
jgi:hypothetical protein